MTSKGESGGRSLARSTFGRRTLAARRRARRYMAERQVVLAAGAATITLLLIGYDTLPLGPGVGMLVVQAVTLLTALAPGSSDAVRRMRALVTAGTLALTALLVGLEAGGHLLLLSHAVASELDSRTEPGRLRWATPMVSAGLFLGLIALAELGGWRGMASELAQGSLAWAVYPAVVADLFLALWAYAPLEVVPGVEPVERDAAAERASADALIAEICHEVRTPMVAIHHAHEVLGRTGLDEPTREVLRRASQSSADVVGVLDDALDLIRLDSHTPKLAVEPFDLRRLADDVGAAVRAEVGARPVRVAVYVAAGLESVRLGDRRRLHQALLHLLSHALKLTERGEVDLHVSEPTPGQVSFLVRDQGRLRVGDAYAGRTADNRFGAGLGVAIARRVLELLGGALEVHHTDGGNAEVRFTLSLPVGERSAPSVSEDVAVVGALKVLVAEDAVVNQWVMRRMLEELGHEVEVVGTGVAAVEAWRKQRPDVILMDLQMPVMDGFTATRRIREEEGAGAMGVPIVALTAHVQEAEVVRCLEAGMSAHLAKPVKQQELQAALVKAYLRSQRGRAAVGLGQPAR
jgi:CheY-like chemotaxis protein